jgi:hypothetical protein
VVEVGEDWLVGSDRIDPLVVISTLVYNSYDHTSERAVVRCLFLRTTYDRVR